MNPLIAYTPHHFPLCGIFDFAGGAAMQSVHNAGGATLQAMWHCMWCDITGGERVPPVPLGWYCSSLLFCSSPCYELQVAIITLKLPKFLKLKFLIDFCLDFRERIVS